MRQLVHCVLLLAIAGCPGDGKDSASGGDTGTTTGASTTGIGMSTTSGQATTGDSATGEGECVETTGEPVFQDELCDPFCQRLVECELDGVFDGCPCYGLLTGAKCLAMWDTAVQCFADESCAALETGEVCWDLLDAAIERCIYGECGCEGYTVIGTGMGPDECIYGEECLDSPSREIECDAQSCACTVDGVPAGTCPAGGVCEAEDFAVVEAKLDECCG